MGALNNASSPMPDFALVNFYAQRCPMRGNFLQTKKNFFALNYTKCLQLSKLKKVNYER